MARALLALALGMAVIAVAPALPPAHCLALAALVSCSPALGRARLYLLVLVLGAAWATLHGQRLLAARLPAACERLPLALTGQVVGLPQQLLLPGERKLQRLRVAVHSLSPQRCAGARLVLLSWYGEAVLQPGDAISAVVRLRVPWGSVNPGTLGMQPWYAQAGIDALGSIAAHSLQRVAAPAGLVHAHHRLRRQLSAGIDSMQLSSPARALLRTLTVADRSALERDTWQLFQHFGVAHLLVISGLHVSLVAGAVLWLGQQLAKAAVLCGWATALRYLPGALALAGAVAYAALAGFSLPTQRALLVVACFICAALLGRRARSVRNLLLAVVLLLVANPLVVLGAGFWLSVGAVAALLWYLNWQPPRARGAAFLRVHLYMSLAMLPLTALFFSGASVVAAAANAVCVPLVCLLVVPLALLGAACWFVSPAFAGLLWQLAALPLDPLLQLLRALREDHGGWLFISVPGAWWQLVPAVLGVALLALPLGRWLRLGALTLLLPLCLAVLMPQQRDRPWLAQLTVLDVGQGTAAVFQAGGRALVYDTGGGFPGGASLGETLLVPFLRRQGLAQLDTVIISHPDWDHSAGLADLLAAFPVSRLFVGRRLMPAPDAAECRTGKAWRWPGEVSFQLLTASEPGRLSSNDVSCVVAIDVAGNRILLAGDISQRRELELVAYWRSALAASVLLVAHHGSATSTAPAFVRTVAPAHAILTHARANRFGHPHPAVLRNLAQAGAAVHSTAAGGALHYRFYRDGRVAVRRERDRWRFYWM